MIECPICKSEDLKERDGLVRSTIHNDIKIIECLVCGHVHLRNIVMRENFYESSSMQLNSIESWRKLTESDDNRRFLTLQDTICNKKVLDVGAGNFNFCKKIKNLASVVIGLELDSKAIEFAKTEELEAVSDFSLLKGRDFDVITSFHTIEHINDPYVMLDNIRNTIKQRGRIFIETPNANDALLTFYKNEAFSKFTYWECHPHLFTATSLKLLAKKVFPSASIVVKYIQRYPLSNHLYWLANSKPGGHLRYSLLNDEQLNNSYSKILSSMQMSDTLWMEISL